MKKLACILLLFLIGWNGAFSQSTTICSGASFTYSDPAAPFGTTYTWTTPVVSPALGVTGSSAGNSPSIFVSQSLTNTTTAQATVTYTVTPSVGTPFQLVVFVNPQPRLSSSVATQSVCSGVVFSYTPASATGGTSFTWTRDLATGISNPAATGSNSPGETLVNTTNSPVNVTYAYTLSANGCNNSQSITTTVNPLPLLSSTLTPADICSGTTFNYPPTSNSSGSTFAWSRSAIVGISNSASVGINNPNEILLNTTTSAISVNYLFAVTSQLGCTNTQNVAVNINALPTLSSGLSPAAICSGTTFNYTPISAQSPVTFSWSRSATPGLNNGAAAGPGTGNPNEFLTNSLLTALPANYSYALTNTTTGCRNTQAVTVSVGPVPKVSSPQLVASSCSGTAFLLVPTGVPNGTLYTWSAPVVTVGTPASVSGGAANTVGLPYISQKLSNTTQSSSVIEYTVTPSTNGCVGSNFLVDVTVDTTNASHTLNNLSPAAICSGSRFDYTPASSSTGVSYAWQRFTTTGINNSATRGSGSISEILSNSTTLPVTVKYVYTLTAGGCSNTQVVTVPVNATPSLNSTLTPVPVCSNAVFNYTPTSATPATSFTWTRASVTGISNTPSSGTGNPAETLVNITTLPVNVVYSYTSTTASGCAFSQDVTVQVNPAPTLSSLANPAAICSGTIFNYSPASATSGVSYSWTRQAIGSISNVSASGTNNPAEVLVNTGLNAVSVPYNYTLTTSGCSNTAVVTVVVNPTPVVSNQTADICNNTSFSVSPASVPANTKYTWALPTSNPAGQITGGNAQVVPQNKITDGALANTAGSTGTATYTVTPAANGCVGVNFTVAVSVTPTPVLTSSSNPPAVCSNTIFSYTPTSAIAGTVFNWTRAAVPGISNTSASGSNSPDEKLINTTSQTVMVTYVYSLSTPGGCINNQSVTVQVYPSATLSTTLTPSAICSGKTFAYSPQSSSPGTVFTWVRNAIGTITNNAGAGLNDVSETLVSNATIPVTVPYTYSLTANGCTNTQIVSVVVNPTPNIVNQVTGICSGVAFVSNPANVPAGTKYTWSSPVINPLGSIQGGSAQPTAQSTVSQVLNNLGANSATAVYTVTPDAAGCTGTNFNVTVSVDPIPVLSSSRTPSAVCSNGIFTYLPTSNTVGSAFSWTRPVVNGISNAAGGGTNNPNETLINITNQPVSVTYTYLITTPGGCVNNQTVTVPVNPSPVLSSTLTPAAICSGNSFVYSPQSAVNGATFTWNRGIIASISNGAGSGSNSISEILVNASVNTIVVPYNFTVSANGCSVSQVVNVPVNPSPNIANLTTASCSNTFFTSTPLNVPSGTQYTWTAPVYTPAASANGGSAQLALQSSISQLLNNQTINPVTATYTVTPVANGCTGVSFTLAVTVNPAPVITNQIISPVCSGTAFNFTSASAPSGTTYTWSSPVQNPLNSLTGASAQAINQTSVSQILNSSNNLQDTAVYIVTPVTNGCLGNNFSLTVPINPVPVINNLVDTICSGSAFTIIPSPVPFNTSYTWAAPVSFPFGAIVGGRTQSTAAANISQTLTNATNTPAQLVYTVIPSAFGCRGNSFTLVETVGVPLAPITDKSATICSGTSFDLTPFTTPANTTYTWTVPVISPLGSVSGSSAATTRQTSISQKLTNRSSVTDTVVYTILPFNTGCKGNTFTATVKVLAVPKATISGKQVVCQYPQDTLSVSFAGTGPWDFNYTDNGFAGIQKGVTVSPFTWVLPVNVGMSSRNIAINYVRDAACEDSIDISSFVQTLNPLPKAQIVSLHGIYLCNNTLDTLYVSASAADTIKNYQWTYNGSVIAGLNTDSVSTLVPGRYNTILTNQYGCIDTAAASVNLSLIQQPNLKFLYDVYCINTPIHFTNLTDTLFTGPINWQWDFGDSTTSNSFHAVDVYQHGGNRHIRLSASQLYCQLYTTTQDTTINIEVPIPSLRLPSVSAYSGVITPLAARNIPSYLYQWQPTRGIDKPNQPTVNFNFQTTQDYLISLTSPAGCVTSDSLLVRVFDNNLVDIMVPKSFTPNGDGINDVLYPYLAGVKTFKYFKVYNRNGQLMFETTNPDAGWNGSLNGTPQVMSVYIWMAVGIANDGTLIQKKGEVLLLR